MDIEKASIAPFWFRTEYSMLPESPKGIEALWIDDRNMTDTNDKQEGASFSVKRE